MRGVIDMRRRGHEIRDPPVQRGLGRIHGIAIVVARNRKDRGCVVVVGLIELIVVFVALAVIVDNISQMVEEAGTLCARQIQVAFHGRRYGSLGLSQLDAPGIADRVEDEPTRLGSACGDSRERCREIVMIGWVTEWRRQRLKALGAMGKR